MSRVHDPRKNAEGYSDPTAYAALRNIQKEEKRLLSSPKRPARPRRTSVK